MVFPALYRAFVEKDMSLLEVNPLIVMENGHLRVLDAKMSFDNNAAFRHAETEAELRDLTEEDAKEIEASKFDLAYVALDGNIGCMVNGAGLAMATMDIIKLYGEEPANFLDVGGGASKEKVTAAFKIITADPAVKGILVNIFGGIMRCDVIAEGVIAAVKEVGLKVPLVVRLEGTNVKEGKAILNASGLDVISADDLDDAAQKIVAAIRGRKLMLRAALAGLLAALAAAPAAAAPTAYDLSPSSPSLRRGLRAAADELPGYGKDTALAKGWSEVEARRPSRARCDDGAVRGWRPRTPNCSGDSFEIRALFQAHRRTLPHYLVVARDERYRIGEPASPSYRAVYRLLSLQFRCRTVPIDPEPVTALIGKPIAQQPDRRMHIVAWVWGPPCADAAHVATPT